MFTIQQIQAAHSKVKSGADFPNYMQDLIQLGVISFETFVEDSHSIYLGKNDLKITSEGKYQALKIASETDIAQFKTDFEAHQKRQNRLHDVL